MGCSNVMPIKVFMRVVFFAHYKSFDYYKIGGTDSFIRRLTNELIKLAKEIDAKLGIQKYEEYKYSRKMKGVKMAHAVTGIYDVIAYAELDDLEEIKKLITEVHNLEGIDKTHTAVSF